jgi:carbonic anhydrase
MSSADESEMAAVEFSLDVLGVRNIIVCGHSECGAMKAILQRPSIYVFLLFMIPQRIQN